ncbi:ABC transporter substrate-binding protein [Nocardioides panacisoli]|uniref:Extracellular solute-binding protein n=1 Tax=Nocardioides panacisoli TaxID=627624 RepID=A0ABP7IW95_9ACTN
MRKRTAPTRRLLAAAAAGSLLLGLTAACGDNSDPTKSAKQESLGEGDQLTITTFGEFGYDELIDQWNQENPDIQVKQTKVALWDDWKNELNTDLQAGSGLPDVVAIEGDYMPAVVAAPDRWVDLSQSEVDGRWLDFKSAAATTPDGALLGYATDAGPEAICYRADLFKDAGLPTDRDEVAKLMTTWDDYFSLGEQFVKNSDAYWYDASGSVAQAMLNQVPYPFEKSDNAVDIENDGLKNVYQTVSSHVGDLSPQVPQWSDDWTANFADSKVATVPCPGWMRSNIKDNTGDPAPKGAVWDVADVFPGGGGNWGGSYLAIPKTSTHQEDALKFITWITAPEQQAQIFEKYGNFPSQVDALSDPKVTSFTDEYFNNAPVGEIFADRAAAIDVQPYKGPLYSDILGKFQDAINRVDAGKDPDESWATFEQDVASLQ